MGVFGINEMLDMQRALRERYGDKWGGLSPEIGKSQLLWMIGEIGEVIDIKKTRLRGSKFRKRSTRSFGRGTGGCVDVL